MKGVEDLSKKRFFVRGGIFTTVVAGHRKPGWKPMIELPPLVFERASPIGG